MKTLGRILKNGGAAWISLPIVLRRRLAVGGLLLLGVDCFYLILTSEPLLTWFAYRFRFEDAPVQSDAIVVLLGGPHDRPTKAAELYRQGMAPVILMGRTEEAPIDETETHRRALMRSGVPSDAIKILPGGAVKNTYDEALRVRDYVRTHPVRRVIIVTTAYHTARARWTFRKVLRGLPVGIRMAASQDPRFTEADWYTRDDGINEYMSEAMKTIYYRLAH